MSGKPHDADHSPSDDAKPDDASESFEGGMEASDAPTEPSAEVLSGDMDDRDPDDSDEFELPDIHEDLDPKPAKSDAGFDGWLDPDDPDGDDPYEALAGGDDDAAAEIADWMAFTGGGETDEPNDEPDVVVDVTDAAVAGEDESLETEASAGEDAHEDTIEFFLDDPGTDDAADATGDVPEIVTEIDEDEEAEAVASESQQDVDEAEDQPTDDEGEGERDLDELLVIPAVTLDDEESSGDDAAELAAEAEAATESTMDSTGEVEPVADETPGASEDAGTPEEDTGEIPAVSFLYADEDEADEGAAVFDFEEFTEDHYLPTATREHQDLAAAIAAAEAEETEQVALAAAIPGLDSGVVGFDDVVETEEAGSAADVKPPTSSDLVLRVGTAVALLAAFFLSLLWRPALIVLALAAFIVAAGEFYSVLIHRGYKPLSIFGFLGILGAGLGTVVWGVVAIPIALAIMITVILLFDAVSRRRRGAVSGFAATIFVAAWIGGFGAFAFGIIASENFRPLVLAVVATVALVDIAAYFVGRTIGRRPLAPVVSPKKTVEGLIGGTLMAFAAGVVASFFIEAMDLPAGLAFGAVVAVFAPLGDLAVSSAKRALDIKDMGSILPGHGGLLDRIDAILAVVPAAWVAFSWMGLL